MVTESGTQRWTWDSTRSYKCGPHDPQNSTCPFDHATGTQLECINGGCTGVGRPSLLQDRIFAYETIRKSVAYKTLGVDRSFAFLLWYYNEQAGNFGLTGRDGTGVRALGALAQAINVLSGAEYVGALPWGNWQSADVFRTPGGELVAVLNVGRPGHQNTPDGMDSPGGQPGFRNRCPSAHPNCGVWAWYYPVIRVEGIDGRPLNTQRSACSGAGGCSFQDDDDGLIYVYLDQSAIHAIQKHTPAGALAAQRSKQQAPHPVRQAMAPKAFVARYNLDRDKVMTLAGDQTYQHSVGSIWGYFVALENATVFNLSVSLFSLASGESAAPSTKATLSLGLGVAAAPSLATPVSVPRMGAANASWVVDLTKYADKTGEVVARVVASRSVVGNETIALPLVVRFIVGRWNCVSEGGADDSKCGAAGCRVCGRL